MLEHAKAADVICMQYAGIVYQFPKKIAEKYRLTGSKRLKPGALLREIRMRKKLTQIEMAKRIKVTQSDISQMESGTRKIGRRIAQRIEKLYKVDYRSFLE
jgi:predicted transcriptional regulator